MLRHLCVPFLLVAVAAVEARAVDCVDTSRYRELLALERALRGRQPPPPVSAGPPPNPGVGDTWDWYIWDLAGFPTATLEPCTVRAEGPNVLVSVRDADWNVHVTQSDVDAVVDHFENRSYGLDPTRGIHSLDTEAFGDPPLGLDADPRTYLLFYDFTISSDGFVGWADDSPDQGTGLDKSNECEVLYLNCGPDPGVDHSPAGRYMLSVVAHEFEHVIHRGYDPLEVNWLDECLAEIGMYLFDPYTEFTDGFRANSDVGVTVSNPGGSYGARFFWGMNLYDHHGGTAISREIVATPTQGIPSVDAALAVTGSAATFSDVFESWVVANWLDDPRVGAGLYDYPNYDYGPFTPSRSFTAYPVASTSGTVALWAADYVRFDAFSPDGLRLTFDGSDSGRFSVQVIAEDSSGAVAPVVRSMTLDAAQAGSLLLPPGTGHDTAALVIGAIAPSTDPASYQYSADRVAPVDLRVVKEAGAPRLDWTTSSPPPFVLRSGADPRTLRTSPDRELRDVPVYFFVDRTAPGPLVFYDVDVQ